MFKLLRKTTALKKNSIKLISLQQREYSNDPKEKSIFGKLVEFTNKYESKIKTTTFCVSEFLLLGLIFTTGDLGGFIFFCSFVLSFITSFALAHIAIPFLSAIIVTIMVIPFYLFYKLISQKN